MVLSQSARANWKVDDGPLWLELEPADWSGKTTFSLTLRSSRRTGAHIGFEVHGPDEEALGGGDFFVDWLGENRLLRWLARLAGDGAAGLRSVRKVRLFSIAPGWWPTELNVGPVEALDEEPTWPVNESDTVIEMGWHETGHACHRWRAVPADRQWFIRPPWPFINVGYQQAEAPGRLTVERPFGLDVSDQSQVLAKLSWDEDADLAVEAAVDGGRTIPLEQRFDAPGRGFLTMGTDLGGARRLDSVRITLTEKEPRRFDGREVAASLFWILLRRPTPLDDAPMKTVTVRLTPTHVSPPAVEETAERRVRQAPFDGGPESTTPIGDPRADGLPYGFFVQRADLPALRERALHGVARPIFEHIRRRADQAIAVDLVDQNYYGTAYGGGIGHPKGFRGAGLRVFAPETAMAHLITGEEKYAVVCRRWLLRAARSDALWGDHGGCVDRPQIGDRLSYWDSITEWNPAGAAGYMDSPFHVADAAFGLVVAYDMLYHALSAAERGEIEDAFADHGVYLLHNPLSCRRDFYVAMNQGVLFCLPLMMMTAFLKERDPVYARMHEWTVEFMEEFGRGPWNEEGVCGEGPGYGIGTVGEYVEALPIIAACAGKTIPEVIPPGLVNVLDYAQHVRSTWGEGPPRFLPISDGNDGWIPAKLLALYAGRLANPVAQFFWNEAYAHNPPANLTTLLFLEDPIAPAEPDLPPAKVFRDQPMAFLRTGWRRGDTLLALNNISNVTGHGHADRASIVLEYGGEELILDPGMIGYEDPNSGQYSQTFCHSTLTFGRRNQAQWEDPYVTAIAETLFLSGETCPGIEGSLDWVVADAGAVYPEATDFLRHVVFLRPEVFLVIDEVEAHGPEAMEVNFTCLGPLRADAGGFVSETEANRVRIHTAATVPLTWDVKPWGTHWEGVPSHRLICATAEPARRCTFLTVLAPSALTSAGATIEADGLSVRVAQGEQTVTATVGGQSVDGLPTDARMAVVNRLAGRRRSVAMLDGTHLGGVPGARAGLSGAVLD